MKGASSSGFDLSPERAFKFCSHEEISCLGDDSVEFGHRTGSHQKLNCILFTFVVCLFTPLVFHVDLCLSLFFETPCMYMLLRGF